jgi:hypothetical protein
LREDGPETEYWVADAEFVGENAIFFRDNLGEHLARLRQDRLYLCQSTPGHMPPPYGVLYRPTLKACFSDSISFAGIEQEGNQWMAQVWFCEVGTGRGDVP